jgi:transcriptional antiterminator RfaH
MAAKEKTINQAHDAPSIEERAHWYAIYTKAAKEDCVVTNIMRSGLEAFNPKIKTNRKVWGMPKEVTVPLFPCYVFAKFGSAAMYSIRYVRGVRRIVGFGVTPIEKSTIDSIRLQATNEFKRASLPEFLPGDPVIVNRGALYGLEGLFVSELSGKERVTILLQTIEWQARVQVEKTALGKSSTV